MPLNDLISKIGVALGIIGGVVGLASTLVLVAGGYYTQSSTISQLKEQVSKLENRTDAAQGDVVRLERQVSILEAKPDTSQPQFTDLKEQVHAINNQVRVVNDKADAALQQAFKKPPTVIDPVQQKCVTLAEEVETGHKGWVTGGDISSQAAAAMDKLGCGKLGR